MNEYLSALVKYLHSVVVVKSAGGDGCVTLVSRTVPIEKIAALIEELKLDHFYSEKLGSYVKVWEKEYYENMILFSDRQDENFALVQGIENFKTSSPEATYDTMIVII